MRPLLSILLSSAAFCALSSVSFAQETQKPAEQAPKEELKPVEETTTVTVTGTKTRSSIDRQTYDVRSDVSTQTGTAADALNKVPSVAVDNDGNVTLRGNSNVQVMVDGKPSAMMQGGNRAATIQSMSGADIESVEVISNPSAQFGSEGGGGIINIVMRKNRKPGASGALIVTAGSGGRYNSTFSGNYNTPKWQFAGGISQRHDGRDATIELDRERFDATGASLGRSVSDGTGRGTRDSLSANLSVDYNLNATDTVGIQFAASDLDFGQFSTENFKTWDGAGTQTEAYMRDFESHNLRTDTQTRLTFNRRVLDTGESLKLDFRVADSDEDFDRRFTSTYSLGGPSPVMTTLFNSHNTTHQVVFSGDYNRNVGTGQIALGFELNDQDYVFDNRYFTVSPTGTALPNVTLSNVYELGLRERAAYVTYQRPLNEKWAIMGGLRVEDTEVDSYLANTNATIENHYTYLYPSLHTVYTLSDTSKLKFSYSKRSRKPTSGDLNPFIIYRDSLNLYQGNALLEPERTDSFEAGFEYQNQGFNYAVRGYYRKTENVITDYSYFTSPNVLLTTRRNGGDSKAGGVEFNIAGKILPSVNVSVNGNANYVELVSDSISGPITQDGVVVSGRANIDWTVRPGSRLQFMVMSSGKQLTGQGYREPFIMTNLSFRQQITPKLAVVATLNDVFETQQMTTVTETDFLRERSERVLGGRIFYIGLNYIFGGDGQKLQEQQGQWPRGPGSGQGGHGGGDRRN